MERPNVNPIREVKDQDVFQSGYRLPAEICIMAPGINGFGNYHKIGDKFTVAVNYGVSIPVHADLWLVGDWWVCGKDWWPRCDSGYYGKRCFVHGLAERCQVWNETDDLTFKLVKHTKITPGFHIEHPQKFRPDETSVGIAIDFAGRFGAKKIDLIGVDLKGDKYWDGIPSTCTHCDRTAGIWPFASMVGEVVKYYQDEGIEFRSLSETALELNVI